MIQDIRIGGSSARNREVKVDALQDHDLEMQPTKKVCETLKNLKSDIESDKPANQKVLIAAINVLGTFLECNKVTDDW